MAKGTQMGAESGNRGYMCSTDFNSNSLAYGNLRFAYGNLRFGGREGKLGLLYRQS